MGSIEKEIQNRHLDAKEIEVKIYNHKLQLQN